MTSVCISPPNCVFCLWSLPVPLLPVPAASPSTSTPFNLNLYKEQLKSSAEKVLQDLIRQKVSHQLRVSPIVTYGEAGDESVEIAEKKKVGLIVTATHGKTGWGRLMCGSVAEKVVRLASFPVLTTQAPHTED